MKRRNRFPLLATVVVLLGCSSLPTNPSAPRPPRTDCGPRALLCVVEALGLKTELETLTARAGTGSEGTELLGLKRAAESLGLEATGVQLNQAALAQMTSPAVAWWGTDHYVAILSVHTLPWAERLDVTIHDPRDAGTKTLPASEVLAQSSGVFLVVKRK